METVGPNLSDLPTTSFANSPSDKPIASPTGVPGDVPSFHSSQFADTSTATGGPIPTDVTPVTVDPAIGQASNAAASTPNNETASATATSNEKPVVAPTALPTDAPIIYTPRPASTSTVTGGPVPADVIPVAVDAGIGQASDATGSTPSDETTGSTTIPNDKPVIGPTGMPTDAPSMYTPRPASTSTVTGGPIPTDVIPATVDAVAGQVNDTPQVTPTPLATPVPAVPAASPSISLSTDNTTPGSTITIAGGNWVPGETVHLTVHSAEIDLGSVTAQADGSLPAVQVTIPASFQPGAHTVSALGSISGSHEVTFEVLAPASTGTSATTRATGISATTGGVASHGSSVLGVLLALGTMMGVLAITYGSHLSRRTAPLFTKR
ncbi:MAG: hypothetical protein FWF25_08680 [Propionibacteriaceae bacterium]|nr:hypothetical protein [Propionibacteriaceae bacterium]